MLIFSSISNIFNSIIVWSIQLSRFELLLCNGLINMASFYIFQVRFQRRDRLHFLLSRFSDHAGHSGSHRPGMVRQQQSHRLSTPTYPLRSSVLVVAVRNARTIEKQPPVTALHGQNHIVLSQLAEIVPLTSSHFNLPSWHDDVIAMSRGVESLPFSVDENDISGRCLRRVSAHLIRNRFLICSLWIVCMHRQKRRFEIFSTNLLKNRENR